MSHRSTDLTLLMLASTLAIPAQATDARPVQDLRAIGAAAEAAVSARGPGITAKADAPDQRLRLAPCGAPLTSTLPTPAKGAKFSVRVRCESGTPWSVLVPVSVATDAEVVVATRALVPGTVLKSDEMKTVRRRIPGFIDCCATDTAALLGQRLRRPVVADAPIPLDSVEAAPVVRRGEIVTVIAGAPGFEVRSTGTALADAREGDAVRVRHATSLRVIQARADTQGVVRADR
jgi:flagella basal body P-ring formation protein FlgA